MTKARILFLCALFVGLALAGDVRLSLSQEAQVSDADVSREVTRASLARQGNLVEANQAYGPVPNSVQGAVCAPVVSVGAGLVGVAALTWQTETVDSAGVVGTYTSLALDVEDRPHISYRDYRRLDLRYAHHDGATWITETVDAVGDAGTYTSLALDSTGQPRIAYCASAVGAPASLTQIRYAAYDGVAWITETVDSAGLGGTYTSLALDSGDRPHISYYHSPSGDLVYAAYDGVAWITETVASAGDGGGYTSLALDRADHPHIGYYNGADGDLKYAYHDGVTWISDTVDSAGDVGLYASLALDAGDRPHVGYCLGSGPAAACNELRYAHLDVPTWITETVTLDDALAHISLALDGAGLPHIAYRGAAGLKVARWISETWAIETADGGDVGNYPSLVLDSVSYPHVSCHDQAGGNLRYAEYDLTPPTIISGPAAISITQDSAVVVWQTDEAGDSTVRYGDQAGTYNLEKQDVGLVQDHSLALSALEPSTVYHYVVQSADAAGNTVASPEGFFETAALSDTLPPVASSLEFVRDEGLYDLYRFSASVSDTTGVERVEFYMDDVLIGTDYAPSSPVYETYMHPFVQGMAREDFFTSHTMRVVAYDQAGLSGSHTEMIIPYEEPMDGELVIELPEPGHILYIEGDFVPPGTHVDIRAYAVEYEWASIIDMLVTSPTLQQPIGVPNGPLGLQAARPAAPADPFKQVPGGVFQKVLYSTQVDRAVARVEFLIDDTPVYTSYPSSEEDFYHDYSWPIGGYSSGTHKIAVKAYDNADRMLYRSRHMGIVRGEPSFDLSRSVSRIENHFRVSLTLINQGTASADVDSVLDNVYGFQPIRMSTPTGQDPAYEVTTQCSLDVTHCDVEIDLGTVPGGRITLAPGESLTLEYLVVPILPTYGWQYAIGPYEVVIGYYGGLTYREQEIARPCYSTEEGELNPIAWAKAEADYLIVTNPAYVRFHNFLNEESVEILLSKLAELAILKDGVLGYVAGSVGDVMDPNFVDGWITQWGNGMKGSDGTADGYLSNGYLLLVGETEIIPAHSRQMNPPWYASWAPSLHIDMTDMYYANTGGNSFNPELIVGRIIGNNATALLTPIQTSMSIYEWEPHYYFDRSHGLILSGWDECRSGTCSDIDFSEEAQDVRSKLINRGTQTSILYTTNYISSTFAVTAFLSLAPDRDIIHLVGHGNPGGCDDLGAGDIAGQLDPFGDANPFVYGSSCLTGRYSDGLSLAEAFLLRGAGVYIGATEVSYCCTNKSVAKKFYDRWDPGESIGHALKQTKVDIGAYDPGRLDRGYMEDMWTAEYHLFGDPKYGEWAPPRQDRLTVHASQALTVTPGLTASLPVVIPAYEITTTLEGETFVDIPGGFTVMEAGKPLVPLYDVNVEYPKGTSVQDVVMTNRSGLTTTTGLSITNFMPAVSGCGCARGCAAAMASPGWWPERDFDWSVQESPAGTSTLSIRIYPFYYNPQTTDAKFYQNYSFEIQTITTTVEVSLLTTDKDAYSQGEEVSIELWLSNPGTPQNVIVDAVVKDGSTGQVVDGLPLRSLKDMTGVSSFSYGWDSSDFGSGQHVVEAEVRDSGGNLLDRAMAGFMLGIHAGRVTTFTATPGSFDVGEPISISLVFSNTGTVPITGTTVIEVQDENSQVIQEFRHEFSDLAPASSVRFDEGWDTSGTEVGTFSIVGYTLYGGKSSAGVVVVSSLRRVYLPLVLRGD